MSRLGVLLLGILFSLAGLWILDFAGWMISRTTMGIPLRLFLGFWGVSVLVLGVGLVWNEAISRFS